MEHVFLGTTTTPLSKSEPQILPAPERDPPLRGPGPPASRNQGLLCSALPCPCCKDSLVQSRKSVQSTFCLLRSVCCNAYLACFRCLAAVSVFRFKQIGRFRRFALLGLKIRQTSPRLWKCCASHQQRIGGRGLTAAKKIVNELKPCKCCTRPCPMLQPCCCGCCLEARNLA